MMLELLMTRQSDRDRTVIANADGLDFLVLDELHTYRGRQGADVASLLNAGSFSPSAGIRNGTWRSFSR
jgi:ATP-dependent helicase YprA (DUF1998 family)